MITISTTAFVSVMFLAGFCGLLLPIMAYLFRFPATPEVQGDLADCIPNFPVYYTPFSDFIINGGKIVFLTKAKSAKSRL